MMHPSAPAPVTSHTTMHLVDGDVRETPVSCRLEYSPAEPYAVHATFHTLEGDISWVFGRDLLRAGLDEPAGEGDVTLWPADGADGPIVCIALSSPTGEALLEADPAPLAAFLTRTLEQVPIGAETELIDLDRLVDRLLRVEPGAA